MNDQTEREHLDAVLDAFVAEGTPSTDSLNDWIRRYPQFERELTEFAASWRLSESLPISPDAAQVPDEVIAQRGLRAVQSLLESGRFQIEPTGAPVGSSAAAPIRSLLEEARGQGLRPRQFAAASDLGESLLAKLDRGLIRFASIPRQAFDSLAAALHCDVASIRTYLEHRSPSVAAAAAFKAEQAPQAGEAEDFFAALAADTTMTDEQRARWLGLAPPGRG